jgi:spectinomycin phosphotransferase
VDWDDFLLAPKERDLTFIGGGFDEIWKTERERVIEDLVVIRETLLLTVEGGARRERSYGGFQSHFEPKATIEIADATYNSITENPNSARW